MYRPGAFAERVAIPERNLIEIPHDMNAAHAALTEPAATSLHAVNRAGKASHRPLSELRALVIGGGVAGIETALEIAEAGHEVVLVEKQASIGGIMAQLDKTYPTMDCSI